MRVRWMCNCDHGHHWHVFKEDGEALSDAELICPQGHLAVIRMKHVPADVLSVVIHPSAMIVDQSKEQVIFESHYYLVLLSREGKEERVSERRNYTKEEVMKLAERFLGRTRERALWLWDNAPL